MTARFIGVGENIHCTRIYKVGGKFVKEVSAGRFAILFESGGRKLQMPVPAGFLKTADWAENRLKHCAAALWQTTYGEPAAREAGTAYIKALAAQQQAAGAAYLDINVDEFSTDDEERIRMIKAAVGMVQQASSLPVSIDSSNPRILRAGLSACDKARGAPMLNSVSLERKEAVGVAAEFGACVIASAAGEKDLPCNTAERMANLDRLMPMLRAAGLPLGKIHVDPLVFPISTDPANGNGFLDAVRAVRTKYGPEVHIVAGLSNVSFGMPNRKLLNQVFAHLAVQAGADGGIVDPLQINASIIAGMDPASAPYKLAAAVLLGEDEFGMNFITAMREEG